MVWRSDIGDAGKRQRKSEAPHARAADEPTCSNRRCQQSARRQASLQLFEVAGMSTGSLVSSVTVPAVVTQGNPYASKTSNSNGSRLINRDLQAGIHDPAARLTDNESMVLTLYSPKPKSSKVQPQNVIIKIKIDYISRKTHDSNSLCEKKSYLHEIRCRRDKN